MNHLQATGLTLVRGTQLLIKGLNLSLEAGQVIAVSGANGAGKSTLLRALAGLHHPFAGSVERLGKQSYLGHEPGLKLALSAAEQLPASALKPWKLEGLASLPLQVLSAGQRQRAALARACDWAAALWLLDEPKQNLDAGWQSAVEDQLAAHIERGGCAIVTMHTALSVPHKRLHLSNKRGVWS